MTKITPLNPSVASVLAEFFAAYQPNAKPAVRSRIDLVRSHLEAHLELEGARTLTSGQLAILRTEKEFDPTGAYSRTARADDLYYAVEHYLDPGHALEPALLRETQLDVVAALAEFLWRNRLISSGTVDECVVIEFEIALSRARAVVQGQRGGR